nr:hypothetical protein [Tanacetum cinerariifolium]
DAEIIFPYEVQGDQTPPPRDESSNSEFEAEEADDELEVEEVGVEPEVEEAGVEPKVEEAGDKPEAEGADVEIMPPKQMSEARVREIIHDQFATSMNEFMANMNNEAGGPGGASGSGGAGGSGGTGGNADGTGVRGTGPTVPELAGLESVFQISECKEKDRVKFAIATLRRRALTWWNGRTKAMGIEAANNTPWSEVKKWMTEEFCPRSIQRMEQELYNLRMKGMDIDGCTNLFHELALMCPRMVEPEAVKVEQYIRDKADEATEGEKRKGESDQGGHGDNRREHNRRQNQRRGNAGAMTNAASNNNETCQKCKNKRHAGDCWKCTKCGKLGHKTKRCRTLEMSCYNCNEKGHRKRDCSKLGRNGQGGNNRGGVYQLGQ